MSGEKCLHILILSVCTSKVSFYGLKAIRTKFVGQPEAQATIKYDCVSYILVRGLVKL